MNVREVMTTDPRCVAPQDTIRTAARIMRDEDTGVVPIVESDNRPVGVITDRDIVVRAVAEGRSPDAVTVGEVVSRDPVTIQPGEKLDAAMRLMASHRVRRLPVVEEGRLVGVLAQADVASKAGEEQTGELVEEISRAG